MRGLPGRLLDRVNPILVKEVRQAVRGRYFKVSYGITLSAALVIALVIMVVAEAAERPDDELGRPLFGAVFCCLAAAAFFWVPFFAFISMGAEWEENTYDLLVLSNLTPRRIVYGKLWSSVVQTLIYFSAFGPFLMFAFLLRGIDLRLLLVLLGAAFVYSVCLSLIAIGVSSLSRVRFVRISLMSLTAAFLACLAFLAAAFAVALATSPFSIGATELAIGLVVMLVASGSLAAFLGEVAVVRLAHPEENRSTGLRVLLLAMVLAALAVVFWLLTLDYDSEVLGGFTVTTLFLLLVPVSFFSTEDDALGRRVRLHVPRRRLLALLAAPFLPGGGRGLIFHLLLSAVLLLGVVAIQLFLRGDLGDLHDNGLYSMLAALLYCFVYLALPQTLLAGRFRMLRWRIVARLLVPILALLALLLPTLVLFFVGKPEHAFEHFGSSPWVLVKLWDGDPEWFYSLFLGVGFVAAFLFAMNLPRMLGGVREVMAASRARREREAERVAAPPEPVEVQDAAA